MCLWVMCIYLLIGTVIFAEWEDWNYLDSVYFCVTSLMKIGFGDLVLGKDINFKICSGNSSFYQAMLQTAILLKYPTFEGGFSYSHGQNNYKICVSVQCSVRTRKLINLKVSILSPVLAQLSLSKGETYTAIPYREITG